MSARMASAFIFFHTMQQSSDTRTPQSSTPQKENAERATQSVAQKAADDYLKQMVQPYRRQMMLALCLVLLNVLLFIAQSALLAQLFADWLNAVSTAQAVSDRLLWQLLPWLALCLIARPAINSLKDYMLLRISVRLRQSVRGRLLQAVISLGPARQHYGSDGSLSTRLLEQVDELDGYISRFYVQAYAAVLTPLFIGVATFFYSPLAGALMLLTAPLVPVFMVLVGSAAARKSQAQFAAMSQMSGRFLDLLRGMPTLKRLHATAQALHEVRAASTDYQRRTMGVLRLAFLSGAVLELFASLAIALVALYLGLGLLGILPWAKGEIPVAYQGALFILLLAPEFYAPLRQLGSDYHAKAKAVAAVAEFYPILEGAAAQQVQQTASETEGTTNTKDTASTEDTADNTAADALQHLGQRPPSVEVQGLHIRTAAGRQRLSPVSFAVQPEQRIAICGESGSGKSSLLQALLGFVPFSGSVLINGTPCSAADMAQTRHRIGYLAQTPSLLPMSIAENLRLARDGASDEELAAVLAAVELWSLIAQLPQGLHTPLGERGKGLSGGQLQRLCIAQLLLRDTGLWLIDEPCAHLDAETAGQIYALLGKLSQGKTVLLVSHDLHGADWIDHTFTLHLPQAAENGDGGNGSNGCDGA